MKYLSVLFILVIIGCSSPKIDNYTKYKSLSTIDDINSKSFSVSLDTLKPLIIRGEYDPNNEVNNAQILYSGAAGIGGLFAQVLVHNAMSSSMQDTKLSNQQIKANKILEPLADIFDGLNQSILEHQSKKYSFLSKDNKNSQMTIESKPIFFLSQDLTYISLKHQVIVIDSINKNTIYQNLIEVISPKFDNNTYENFKSNNGSLLIETIEQIYNDSLNIAMSDILGEYSASSKKQKSFKILKGEKLRIERGISVFANDENSIIRNLRGWLISFPNSDDIEKS